MPELTRQQQVQKALRILLPRTASAEDRELCKREIVGVLDAIKRQLSRPLFGRMDKALQKVALLKAELIEADPAGPWDQLDVQAQLERCAELLAAPRGRTGRTYRQHYAINFAWFLCFQWSRSIARTQGGPLLKLAAVLYGDDSRNLYGSLRIEDDYDRIALLLAAEGVIGIDNLTFSDGVVSEDEARQFMAVLPSLSRRRES
jgi:hypothetical protein